MREVVKSLGSLSWALSLVGIQAAGDLLRPRTNGTAYPTAPALDAVSRAAEEQLGTSLQGAYRAADGIQRNVVDLSFSRLGSALGPTRFTALVTDAVKRSGQALGRFVPAAAPGGDDA